MLGKEDKHHRQSSQTILLHYFGDVSRNDTRKSQVVSGGFRKGMWLKEYVGGLGSY
jgi:hypothetical protein